MFQIINICRLYQRHLVCHRNLGYHQAQRWFCPLLDGLWQQHLLPLHPHPPRHPPQHLLSRQCRQSTQVLRHYHLVIWYLLNLLIPTQGIRQFSSFRSSCSSSFLFSLSSSLTHSRTKMCQVQTWVWEELQSEAQEQGNEVGQSGKNVS